MEKLPNFNIFYYLIKNPKNLTVYLSPKILRVIFPSFFLIICQKLKSYNLEILHRMKIQEFLFMVCPDSLMQVRYRFKSV